MLVYTAKLSGENLTTRGLEHIFNTKSIAVIGASATKGSVGYAIMKNLLNAEFQGTIYPINPNRISVLGVPCYKSINELAGKAEMAVIATPAKSVAGIVKECGKSGVKGLVIVSSGFGELGPKGKKEELKIKEIAVGYGMRIIGPNCLGVINPRINLNASFAIDTAKKGSIAFISQSGALCSSIIDWANYNDIGFSYFVSIGSMVDANFSDMIDFFGEDPYTKSIIVYIESVKDAKDFISAARGFTLTKPIIVLKSGKTAEGAKAAASHTGAMAGEDSIYDAAFQRAGVLRVDEIEDLFNCAKSLAMEPLPKGNNLAVITNAGGPGVLATDACEKYGCKMADLSRKTIKALNKNLPACWSKRNPVDVLGDAGPERYQKAVELCLEDENVNGISVIFTPQAASDAEETAKRIVEVSKKHNKPIFASFMGGMAIKKAAEILKAGGIPNYFAPEKTVKTFSYMHKYNKNIELLYETPLDIVPSIKPDKKKLNSIINDCFANDITALPEFQSKEFLKEFGIDVVQTIMVKDKGELKVVAGKIKFPVVLKINSPDIVHKTDAGCVILNIKNQEALVKAYDSIIENAHNYNHKARIEGVTVQEFVENSDYEIIIGSKKDNLFGRVIMFGMGGVGAEVFKDKNVGFPPLTQTLAKRLMEGTKIYPIMKKGYRNIKPVNSNMLEKLLIRFSYLVTNFPEIKEVDINPIAINKKGAFALDARIILDFDFVKTKLHKETDLAIEPYPSEFTKKVNLAKGKKALFRVIKPEDESEWIELFKSLSAETKRYRFFHPIKEITREMLIRYCHIDYSREIAIAVEMIEGNKKKIVGVGRIIIEHERDIAEFAIAVTDKWQNLGLGTKLTEYMIEIAKIKKLKKMFVEILPDNYKMIHLSKKFGFKIKERESDTVELVLEIN